MADINSIMSRAMELRTAITRLLISSTYHRRGDLSEVSLNPHDSEQLFLRDELEQTMLVPLHPLGGFQLVVELLDLQSGELV